MNKILEIKFGSHLYGTDTLESDMDFKGIYLPTARQIILNDYPKTINSSRKKKECERNTKDDVDVEIFSLDRFLELLIDSQTVALDMLFAPESHVVFSNDKWDLKEIWHTIKENKDRLLTKNVNAFCGYARRQAAVYGIKGSRMDALKRTMVLLDSLPEHDRLGDHWNKVLDLVNECTELVSLEKTSLVEIVNIPGPDKITPIAHLHVCGRKMPITTSVKKAKETYGKVLSEYGNRAKKAHLAGGVDWKALSHAVRVNCEALELLQTGNITFPRPEKEILLAIKKGQIEDKVVYNMIEQGLADLTEASKVSKLPDNADKQWVNDFIYEIYSNIVKNS